MPSLTSIEYRVCRKCDLFFRNMDRQLTGGMAGSMEQLKTVTADFEDCIAFTSLCIATAGVGN